MGNNLVLPAGSPEPAEDMTCENIYLSRDENAVCTIDQTLLPNEERIIACSTMEECCDTIKKLKVRGAPAIGMFAAYGLYVLARGLDASVLEGPDRIDVLNSMAETLNATRPTAVNLAWALERMMRSARQAGDSREELLDELRATALSIQAEDITTCTRIAELGLSLLMDGDGVITHCNAGPIATSRYGTALGPAILAHERGMNIHMYTDETRPLLQGARLSTYEMQKAGVEVTLICDNMASFVMSQGLVQACMVGCDRVAANGDTANKIGTGGLAIIAAHYGIPFYVMCPTSTIDLSCATGADIPIEMRDGEEIASMHYAKRMAPKGIDCLNPAFDVTDHSLITAVVTEKGICYPPFTESLAALDI